ncbi:alpha beta fold family domain-containing protein [Cyclospora cayetanensis]|uniref:Alpha beta fold family domain-containing protein n=1 Tax=Cyclospora cayetanensis TaxID=88456 RepID=A0A1D3CT66_9EIME|nr:alpha beta fold family domain-containing protein [Cyclospora cayetanensis]
MAFLARHVLRPSVRQQLQPDISQVQRTQRCFHLPSALRSSSTASHQRQQLHQQGRSSNDPAVTAAYRSMATTTSSGPGSSSSNGGIGDFSPHCHLRLLSEEARCLFPEAVPLASTEIYLLLREEAAKRGLHPSSVSTHLFTSGSRKVLPPHGEGVQHVQALAKALGIRLVLIGHSMGGLVCMQTALDALDSSLFKALVVLDIAPSPYLLHPQAVAQMVPPPREGAYSSAALVGILLDLPLPLFTSKAAAAKALQQLQPPVKPAVLQWLLLSLATETHREAELKHLLREQVHVGNAERMMHDPQQSLSEGHREPYKAPTLFIRGSQSPWLDYKLQGPAIQRHFPGAVLREVAQAGHWLHAQQPQKTQQVIQEFLQSI